MSTTLFFAARPTTQGGALTKVLLIGARGAVGAEVAALLAEAGHRVTPAGRTAPEGGVAVDLTTPRLGGLRALAEAHDVVVNVSGTENPEVAAHLGDAIFVDISATAAYLEALQSCAENSAMVLGVGLAPGLTTLMVDALTARPGDEIDVAITLGSGEKHGPAAVAWTAGLAGAQVHGAEEGVLNFRESVRIAGRDGVTRRYLRADFPDDLLVGQRSDLTVRSHLALTSPLMTAALGVIGRFPSLSGLAGLAPSWGSEDWRIIVHNRNTQRQFEASGRRQSVATAAVTAKVVDALGRVRPSGPVTIADVLTLADVADIATVPVPHRG